MRTYMKFGMVVGVICLPRFFYWFVCLFVCLFPAFPRLQYLPSGIWDLGSVIQVSNSAVKFQASKHPRILAASYPRDDQVDRSFNYPSSAPSRHMSNIYIRIILLSHLFRPAAAPCCPLPYQGTWHGT